MVPVSRLVVVLAWWARPRAAMRCQAPVSRSPCQPQLGHLAHFQPGAVGWSGDLQWRSDVRQRGQFFEVPLGGTVTTAMPRLYGLNFPWVRLKLRSSSHLVTLACGTASSTGCLRTLVGGGSEPGYHSGLGTLTERRRDPRHTLRG
jgi:hypothetical protein